MYGVPPVVLVDWKVRLPGPVMFEVMVFELFAEEMTAPDAKWIVPPERVMSPDPEPKVMLPELTVPEMLTVPAPSPVPVPKLVGFAVVVMVENVPAPPVLLVFQNASTPHVPPAVPKPAVVPSVSQ